VSDALSSFPTDLVPKTREIRLIRHGRSAHLLPTRRITASEFRQWIEAYNEAGIAADSFPSQELIAAASGVTFVVCSDLPRSMESARRLAPEAKLNILPLFREAGRPLAGNWRLKLPLSSWDHVSVALWRRGVISGDESIRAATRRAKEVAQILVGFAEASGRVLCVGHGTFNALVGLQLRKRGWEGPNQISDHHWEGGTYERIT
jgi:broad specificity phosphatase PhoE